MNESMKRWRVWVLALLLAVIVSLGIYLYFWGGLKQFARAMFIMANTGRAANQWDNFYDTHQEYIYGGLLAGTWFDRVWVWGSGGLKPYRVDESTVYSWFDGCNPETLALLNSGKAGAVKQALFTDKAEWREKIKAGDYVRVKVIQPGMDGIPGNLREVYDYNFWLFLEAGMEERCAK